MKKITVILFFLSVFSCQLFNSKVPDEDALLQKRLGEINWNEVSSYPSIAECDGIVDEQLKKECFFTAMARLVQERLDADTLAMLLPQTDTIDVKVTVYPDATLTFEPQFPKDSVPYNTARVDSILKARLNGFLKVEPALKEGIPVTSQFILPVILNVQE